MGIKPLSYWLVAITPLIIFWIGPTTWPIMITDNVINNGLLAFGIVASMKLIYFHNKVASIFIASFICGLYLSIIAYAIYSRLVLSTFV